MSQNPQNPYDPNQYGQPAQPAQYGQPDPYGQYAQAGYGAPGVPLGYGGYPNPGKPRRPGSVTALAIIGCIVGGFFTLCMPCGLFGMVAQVGQPNAAVQELKHHPVQYAWAIISTVITLAAGVALLVGSIGSFSLKRWARKLMIVSAVALLALQAVSVITQVIHWESPAAAFANNPDPNVRKMAQYAGFFVAIVILIGAAYIAFLVSVVVVYCKRHVIDAFDGAAAAASPGYPPGYDPNYPAGPYPGGGYPGAGA